MPADEHPLRQQIRRQLEQLVGSALDGQLELPTACSSELLAEQLLATPGVVELQQQLLQDAQAAAAAADAAADAPSGLPLREQVLGIVSPSGPIAQALEAMGEGGPSPQGGPKQGLAEWWDGGEDGVLDLDAFDDDDDGLPPYQLLGELAVQLDPAAAAEAVRHEAHAALEAFRDAQCPLLNVGKVQVDGYAGGHAGGGR